MDLQYMDGEGQLPRLRLRSMYAERSEDDLIFQVREYNI